MIFLAFALLYIRLVTGQTSQWIDTFQKAVCQQRWAQMDWLTILRPCRYKMEYGRKIEEGEKTSTKWSHTLGLKFEKTGEFSKIALQSRKSDGRNKKNGGDTWRIFIRGKDNITPFISDLNNGVYEADFIAISPGFYKVEIVLESTLCQAYQDPPQDWLTRDAETIISDEKAKLQWQPMRGGNISFRIDVGSQERFKELKKNFYRYKDSCGEQFKCELLWKGIGRWSNSSWKPYLDETFRTKDSDNGCYRESEGVLKVTGDDLSRRLSLSNATKELCTKVFSECKWEKPGEQPDAQIYMNRNGSDKASRTFSTKTYLENLKKLLDKDYMNAKSGLLLNYGHPFVQNIAFRRYRTFIDRVAKIVKKKYKGRAVWQTMASTWIESNAPENHFKNHQRIKLFNAYATSVMCNAGIAVLDVFQMTESVRENDRNEIVGTISGILIEYFKAYPTRNCTATPNRLTGNVNSSKLVDLQLVNHVVDKSTSKLLMKMPNLEQIDQL